MAHANNAVYLDWLEEAIAAAGRRARPRRVTPAPLSSRVRAAAAAGGDELEIAAWADPTRAGATGSRSRVRRASDIFRATLDIRAGMPERRIEDDG